MNEHENNFDNVRRLLKLKRHEVPPPGYFNHFSDQVISRIRAGKATDGQTMIERLQVQAPWLGNLLSLFETKPGVVGAFATSLCLLLAVSVMVSEHSDSTSKGMMVSPELASSPVNPLFSAATTATAAAGDSGGIAINTNPVISLQPVSTFFGQSAQNPLLLQQASFAPGH
jgi:hypothetical protein